MKLFYICYENLSEPKGSTTHIREVVENFQKLGNELVLFAPKLGKLNSNIELKCVYIPTIKIRLLGECLYYFFLVFYLLAYQIRLRANIFYVREMTLCLPVAVVSKLCNVPHIIEVNGAPIQEMELRGISKIKVSIYKKLQMLNFYLCNRIIVVPEHRDCLKQYYDNITHYKTVTIPNGVNGDLFRPSEKKSARKDLGFSNDYYYITYVGSFYPHHALDYLVRLIPLLLKRVNNLNVIFVGDGFVKVDIEDLAMQLGVMDCIHFRGSVDYQNVHKFINASDLCVYFNSRPVIYSIKLMEYLACGRPVIVNWGAFGDKFSNNKTQIGIQIDLNNLEEAADSIIKLLENEDLRISMGKRARQFIEKNYSWEITAKQILEECIKLTQ